MSLLASIAPLVVVLGMLAALLWWLRRTAAGAGARAGARGRYIQLVETVELGPGRCLHLITLGERALVVASTAQRCDLLCELENLPAEKPVQQTAWTELWLSRLRRA